MSKLSRPQELDRLTGGVPWALEHRTLTGIDWYGPSDAHWALYVCTRTPFRAFGESADDALKAAIEKLSSEGDTNAR